MSCWSSVLSSPTQIPRRTRRSHEVRLNKYFARECLLQLRIHLRKNDLTRLQDRTARKELSQSIKSFSRNFRWANAHTHRHKCCRTKRQPTVVSATEAGATNVWINKNPCHQKVNEGEGRKRKFRPAAKHVAALCEWYHCATNRPEGGSAGKWKI